MQYVITQGTIRLVIASLNFALRNSSLNCGMARLKVELRWVLRIMPRRHGVKSKADGTNHNGAIITPHTKLMRPSRNTKSKNA